MIPSPTARARQITALEKGQEGIKLDQNALKKIADIIAVLPNLEK